MDLIDLFWNLSQSDAIKQLEEAHTAGSRVTGQNAVSLRALEKENYELKIRIGVLIRVLIEKGVFTADEFSRVVVDTQKQLAPAKKAPKPIRRLGSAFEKTPARRLPPTSPKATEHFPPGKSAPRR